MSSPVSSLVRCVACPLVQLCARTTCAAGSLSLRRPYALSQRESQGNAPASAARSGGLTLRAREAESEATSLAASCLWTTRRAARRRAASRGRQSQSSASLSLSSGACACRGVASGGAERGHISAKSPLAKGRSRLAAAGAVGGAGGAAGHYERTMVEGDLTGRKGRECGFCARFTGFASAGSVHSLTRRAPASAAALRRRVCVLVVGPRAVLTRLTRRAASLVPLGVQHGAQERRGAARVLPDRRGDRGVRVAPHRVAT